MKSIKLASALLAATLISALAAPANAAIIVSEVNPNGSSASSGYGADWFELTNTGNASVSITGWKMDDDSGGSNVSSAAVSLTGITSIGAGQSVIFLEGSSSVNANFLSAWFGSNVPANLLVGNYSGSGVGLSNNSDAVNIYDTNGNRVTYVTFGASSFGTTFDNAAGLTGAITKLSAVGVNGAFKSANNLEIGSVGAVPEPESLALMLSGMLVVGAFARKRKN